MALVPGSPCSGNRGYCDKFKVCRILDADGPIARLKNSFLKLDEFDDLGGWMKVCCYHSVYYSVLPSSLFAFTAEMASLVLCIVIGLSFNICQNFQGYLFWTPNPNGPLKNNPENQCCKTAS